MLPLLLLIAFFVIAVSCWIGYTLGHPAGQNSQFVTDLINYQALLAVALIHAENTGQPIETVIRKVRNLLEEAANQEPEVAREMMANLFAELSQTSARNPTEKGK